MKKIVLFLCCLLGKTIIAQDAGLVFKVDEHYIFADTNGNIPIPKRFDFLNNLRPFYIGEYIVRADNKYGLVQNNKFVFPCEYDLITSVSPVHQFFLYVLSRNGRSAIATINGVIHTGFDYDRIDVYELDKSSRREDIYRNGGFFRLQKGKQLQLMYISDKNKSVLLTEEPVDEIKDFQGLFVFKKGKQSALLEFDAVTKSMKEVLPLTEQIVDFRANFYRIWNPVEKVVSKYSYEHQLLETVPVTEAYQLPPKTPERVEDPDYAPERGDDGERKERVVDLKAERVTLEKAKGYGKVLNAFYPLGRHLDDFFKGAIYRGALHTTGSKGDWLVTVTHAPSKVWKPLKDTAFHVHADRLITDGKGENSLIITQVGSLYGVVDSRGNELYPPKWEHIEILRADNNLEWLVIRQDNQSMLIFYNQFNKKLATVLVGKLDDQYENFWQFVKVTRKGDKNAVQSKLVKLGTFNEDGSVNISGENEFYDSIVRFSSLPYFFQTFKGNKRGVLAIDATSVVPCIYDSIQLNAYYFVRHKKYTALPEYTTLQPILAAFSKGKQEIFHPTADEYSNKLVHSFSEAPLSGKAKISDDGLYVMDPAENGRVEIYSINGKKLSSEPIILHKDNQKMASFTKTYWYVRGKDANNRDVLIGQNGAWFVLPDIGD